MTKSLEVLNDWVGKTPEIRIGVDIGGGKTKLAALLVVRTKEGKKYIPLFGSSSYDYDTNPDGPEACLTDLLVHYPEFVKLCRERLGVEEVNVTHIGRDYPGPTDLEGTVLSSANMKAWAGKNFDRMVGEAFPNLSGAYANDGDATGLAEYALRRDFGLHLPDSWLSPGLVFEGGGWMINPEVPLPCLDAISVTTGVKINKLIASVIGTGYGGGIILNGLIDRGSAGTGSELGHDGVPPYDLAVNIRCGCGGLNCVETRVSLTAIRRTLGKYSNEELREICPMLLEYNTVEERAFQLRTLANKGDLFARQVFLEQADHFGRYLGKLTKSNDASLFVLGGGICQLNKNMRDAYLKEVKTAMWNEAFEVYRIKYPTPEDVPVVWSIIGEAATALGAAMVTKDSFFEY